jgi:hypothetical protein
VNLDTCRRRIKRRRAELLKSFSGRANFDDIAPYQIGVDAAVQNIPRGDEAFRFMGSEVNPHSSVRVGRHCEISNLNRVESGMLAERGRPIRPVDLMT